MLSPPSGADEGLVVEIYEVQYKRLVYVIYLPRAAPLLPVPIDLVSFRNKATVW